MEFQQPPSLKSGDKVAIVSPSSGMPFLYPWVYEQGLERLKDIFQIQPIEFPITRQSPEYLSSHLRDILKDILLWKKNDRCYKHTKAGGYFSHPSGKKP